eukprot:COSAG02_NODE_5583_length_4212_cov_2.972296_3_plen_149_part_00
MPLPLSANALILGDWKLLTGEVGESGWTGYIYPNASTAAGARIDGRHDCTHGCLFNVADDQGEHIDLAREQPARVAAMNQTLRMETEKFFTNTDRGKNSALCPAPDLASSTGAQKSSGDDCGCWMAIHHYGMHRTAFSYELCRTFVAH